MSSWALSDWACFWNCHVRSQETTTDSQPCKYHLKVLCLTGWLTALNAFLTLPQFIIFIGWIVTIGMMFLAVFVTHDMYKDGIGNWNERWSKAGYIAYYVSTKVIWGLGLGWITLACDLNYGSEYLTFHVMAWLVKSILPVFFVFYRHYRNLSQHEVLVTTQQTHLPSNPAAFLFQLYFHLFSEESCLSSNVPSCEYTKLIVNPHLVLTWSNS